MAMTVVWHAQDMTDTALHEPVLGLRRSGKAVVLLTYRGDW